MIMISEKTWNDLSHFLTLALGGNYPDPLPYLVHNHLSVAFEKAKQESGVSHSCSNCIDAVQRLDVWAKDRENVAAKR
jgi:hypothetical protein